MIKVSMNILSKSSTLNNIPMYWEFKSPREFTDFIRRSATDILSWNFQTYGTVSGTKLGVYIVEDLSDDEYTDWSFIINCKNIREFKDLIKMDYQEFEAHLRQHKREGKINEIIL